MVDVSVTAADVLKGAGAITESGVLGEAGTAGQVVYRNADGKYYLADADSATEAVRNPRGILLNGGAANQACVVQTAGRIDIGGTVAVGTVYVLADTPGGIMPAADLASGDYTVVIGIAVSVTDILLNIFNGEVAVPV